MGCTKKKLYLGVHSDQGIRVVLGQSTYEALCKLRVSHSHDSDWGSIYSNTTLPRGIALFLPEHRRREMAIQAAGLVAGNYQDMGALWRERLVCLGENHLGTLFIPLSELQQMNRDAFVTDPDSLRSMFNITVSPVTIRPHLHIAVA